MLFILGVILVLLKALGLIHLGWGWCVLPMLISAVLAAMVLVLAAIGLALK